MRQFFAAAIAELDYQGKFLYAYASKANAAEEVVRTVLGSGAHYELSSWIDVQIVHHLRGKGLIPDDIWIICNGFKQSGTQYSDEIMALQKERGSIIPVIEDLSELPALIQSETAFEVGLRLKSYGQHADLQAMDAANSRFGMPTETLLQAADQIENAANLKLKLLHAMVGSQLTDEVGFLDSLTPAIELYARMRQQHSDLTIFDFGGGMPVAMTLDFQFDYVRFTRLLLGRIQEICGQYNVPVPDVLGEFGRYTVSEHGVHIFKVLSVKENQSQLPWYIIDGSVMSSFPDTWALAEHFVVLPINHLDSPFQQVQIGGITCDSDDVYPPKTSQSPLYLPVNTQDLYIGFFNVGAYQEMLGGVGGSKHCVIPEADELIIDKGESGQFSFERLQGQSAAQVLRNLGYK
jgi:arginine decarboxylase